MMNRLDEYESRPVDELIDKAFDMVTALCKPRGSEGSREWMMSIPVQVSDPDIVIGTALRKARAELAALRERVRELEPVYLPSKF